MYSGLKIIDSHAHFPVNEPIVKTMVSKERFNEFKRLADKKPVSKAQEQWRKAWGFAKPDSTELTDEELAQKWVEELDKRGIEKIVWVTGGGNERLASIIKMAPDRFLGYAHHNLFAEDAASELKEAVIKLGLKGYKILAPILDKSINDKSAYPVWEVCAKYNIPVLIHFGIIGSGSGIAYNENINPALLESIAKDFPKVNFIIPHFGCGYTRELLFLGWVCENVYIDSSGSNQWMCWMPYPVTLESSFEKFYRTFGPGRIIFGSDSSYFPRGFAMDYLKEQNRVVRFLNIPENEVQMIFGGNIARLLNIEL